MSTSSALRSESRRYIKWVEIVRLARKMPNQWFLALNNTPVGLVNTVRKRRVEALRHDDGHLECESRNEYQHNDGITYCDAYVRWVPIEKE